MSDEFRIEVNGITYEKFTNAEVFKSIETASGEFKFSATNAFRQDFPFSKGDKCVIYIGNNKIITGYINGIGGAYSADSHELRIKGRDKTQDLIDSSITGNFELKSPITLQDIIKKVLTLNGITDIKVISNETIKSFSKSEIAIAEEGENAFSFIEKYCRKRQVLFTTNEDGDIVLTRAGTDKYSTLLKSNKDDPENNILEAAFVDTDEERYNTYVIKTQGNFLDELLDDNRQSKKGIATDNAIRSTRILVINSNLSSDIQTNIDRATWEANIRRTRGFQYKCKIRGYYLDANKTVLIKPNNVIQVSDDVFGIQKDCLIKSIRYSKGLDGSFASIDLVNKDAFTLQASQDEVESKFNKSDDILAGLGI